MYLGVIVELASADELYASSLHPYTEALLSAILRTDPDHVPERIILPGDVPNPPPGLQVPSPLPLCPGRLQERGPPVARTDPRSLGRLPPGGRPRSGRHRLRLISNTQYPNRQDAE